MTYCSGVLLGRRDKLMRLKATAELAASGLLGLGRHPHCHPHCLASGARPSKKEALARRLTFGTPACSASQQESCAVSTVTVRRNRRVETQCFALFLCDTWPWLDASIFFLQDPVHASCTHV